MGTLLVVDPPEVIELFREYGIPDRIRTENGRPFAFHALGHTRVKRRRVA